MVDNSNKSKEVGGSADYHKQATGHWILDTPISTPMSIYETYKASRRSWGIDALGSMICIVQLNDGTTGIYIHQQSIHLF